MIGKKEKNRIIVATIILFLAAAVLLFSLIFNKEKVVDEKEFSVRFEVAEVTGLRVEESLDFGRIIRGASGGKKINIENNFDFPVRIEFGVEGDVKSYLIFEEEIYLNPRDRTEFSVSTVIFENDQPYGNYTGIFKAVFKQVR